ncbi:MAG: response regulator transcription factor [Saprospiraceae bacterium]|nr:response regulator transcription factor [Bacteroidia bacterium]NNE16759.1 response regulator transcription factor [Saprospiraceae bacterium]NNL92326.1 response regulator transcription factor [Saprospiraceae bacterium]
MSKPHILYVEDDEVLSFVTKDNLELNGYQVTHAKDGEEAVKFFRNDIFDLCLVDVMLPHKDGFEVATEIRSRHSEIPIIFLTAKSLKEDRIKGLKIGADDYITKPFSIEELILKIKVFLKRKYVTGKNDANVLRAGEYVLDFENLKLTINDSHSQMTKKEAELLKMLITNKNKIVERGVILERIWGENDYFMGRSMDVFISRLRKYLKEDSCISIENIHGVGFRLNEK